MYNSRTFSQKCDRFQNKNPSEECATTENKTQNYSTTFINTFYLTLIDYIKLYQNLPSTTKIKTHFSNQINYVPYKHLRS